MIIALWIAVAMVAIYAGVASMIDMHNAEALERKLAVITSELRELIYTCNKLDMRIKDMECSEIASTNYDKKIAERVMALANYLQVRFDVVQVPDMSRAPVEQPTIEVVKCVKSLKNKLCE